MDPRLMELRQAKTIGDYRAVLRLAGELLQDPERLTDADGFEVAQAATNAAVALEHLYVAREFATAARRWADGTGRLLDVAVAAYQLGTVHLHLGDYHEALGSLREALATDPGPEWTRYHGAALFNLGLVHQHRREYPDASQSFRAARVVYSEQANTANVIRCDLQAAWCELMAGRIEPAGAYLGQALGLLDGHDDIGLRTTYHTHQALYLSLSGNVQSALGLCELVGRSTQVGVTPLHRADAAWIAGECALALGQLDAASKLAAWATDHALNAKWTPAMTRANDLTRRIREAADQQSA